MRQLVGVADHEPLRADKTFRSVAGLARGELISVDATAKSSTCDSALGVGEIASVGVGDEQIQAMAEAFVQARLKRVVPCLAGGFVDQQAGWVPSFIRD